MSYFVASSNIYALKTMLFIECFVNIYHFLSNDSCFFFYRRCEKDNERFASLKSKEALIRKHSVGLLPKQEIKTRVEHSRKMWNQNYNINNGAKVKLCFQIFNKYAEQPRDHKLSKYKQRAVRIRKINKDKWKWGEIECTKIFNVF